VHFLVVLYALNITGLSTGFVRIIPTLWLVYRVEMMSWLGLPDNEPFVNHENAKTRKFNYYCSTLLHCLGLKITQYFNNAIKVKQENVAIAMHYNLRPPARYASPSSLELRRPCQVWSRSTYRHLTYSRIIAFLPWTSTDRPTLKLADDKRAAKSKRRESEDHRKTWSLKRWTVWIWI